MFLTTIIATFALAASGAQAKPLSCPIMGGAVSGSGLTAEYNGVKVGYCCEDCQGQFEHDPAKALKDAAKGKQVVGEFLFDPVSHHRVEPAKSAGSSDYAGIRYYFQSADAKKAFDKEPKKFAALPTKEALFCPVNKEAVASYSKASGYADYKGARYYFCCAGCDAPFLKDPTKYAANAADKVKTPTAIAMKGGEHQAAPAAELFKCRHCGLTIKIDEAKDLSKTCGVCGCGKPNGACKPGR